MLASYIHYLLLKAQKDGEQKQKKPFRQEQLFINLYLKLRQLIITSKYLPPESLIATIKKSSKKDQQPLLEIQALLLERLGLHHQVYINTLSFLFLKISIQLFICLHYSLCWVYKPCFEKGLDNVTRYLRLDHRPLYFRNICIMV